MQKYAIIVAGGTGSRIGGDLPKQFLELQNKAIILYSIDVLQQINDVQIIVVVHKDFIEYLNELLLTTNYKNILITIGGETRYESVQKGLAVINNYTDADKVIVHDAARPFINKVFVENIFNAINNTNCVIPAIAIPDSIRQVTPNGNNAIDRDSIKIIQTPQGGTVANFKKAFDQSYVASFTDEASVCETINLNIELVDGLSENIKITTPQNLVWGDAYLK